MIFLLAQKLLLQVVDLDRNNLEPHLHLVDLAFRTKNTDGIETQIKEIKQIEGADGPTGRYQEIHYTLWQAEQSTEPGPTKGPAQQREVDDQ